MCLVVHSCAEFSYLLIIDILNLVIVHVLIILKQRKCLSNIYNYIICWLQVLISMWVGLYNSNKKQAPNLVHLLLR